MITKEEVLAALKAVVKDVGSIDLQEHDIPVIRSINDWRYRSGVNINYVAEILTEKLNQRDSDATGS